MKFNFAELQAPIPASFEYVFTNGAGEETRWPIELKINRMSMGMQEKLAADEALEGGTGTKVRELLAQLVTDWNIDMNGEPFPPSAENLMLAPSDFIGQLSVAVFEKLNPNPERAANSPAGSVPEEVTASAAVN